MDLVQVIQQLVEILAEEGNKDLSDGFLVSEDRGRISITIFGDE